MVHPERLALLAAIAAMTSLGVDMCLPAVPLLTHDLHASCGSGVLSSSLFMAGFACTPLLGGPLSDCIGRRRTLLMALGGFVLAAAGCALATGLQVYLLFRFVQGSAIGIATTLPLAIVGDLLSGKPARLLLSEVATLSSLLPVVAPLLGNVAIHAGGWRTLFAAQAAYGCLLLAFALAFKETLPAEAQHPLHLLELACSTGQLLRNRVLCTRALAFGMAFACTFCFTAASPLILISHMHLQRPAYALIFAVNSVGSLLGCALSVALNRRGVSGARMIQCGLALAAVAATLGFVLQWGAQPVGVAFLPVAFCALFGFNLAAPSLQIEALDAVPQLRGTASGLLRGVFTLFNFGSSALLAMLCSRWEARTEFFTGLCMAVLATGACALYVLVRGRRPCREGLEEAVAQ